MAKIERKIQNFVLLSAPAILLFGLLRSGHSVKNHFALESSKRVLEEKIAELEGANQKLDMEIDRLSHSPKYARKVLRDRYHITEDNESIIFLAD